MEGAVERAALVWVGFPKRSSTWLQNKTEQAPLVLDLKSKVEVTVLATNDSSSILYFFFFF